jgi:hypothetical protein
MMSVLKHQSYFSMHKSWFTSATIEAHTDASAYGLGGVLIQNDKPVWCVSASMTESQRTWGATDRELLAVKQVVKKLSRFL